MCAHPGELPRRLRPRRSLWRRPRVRSPPPAYLMPVTAAGPRHRRGTRPGAPVGPAPRTRVPSTAAIWRRSCDLRGSPGRQRAARRRVRCTTERPRVLRYPVVWASRRGIRVNRFMRRRLAQPHMLCRGFCNGCRRHRTTAGPSRPRSVCGATTGMPPSTAHPLAAVPGSRRCAAAEVRRLRVAGRAGPRARAGSRGSA